MRRWRTVDLAFMRRALALARRGYGRTSPNPMVGAVLVKRGRIVGEGWHHAAGRPHAEMEALQAALHRGHNAAGATLYVTLEPCCTRGRTPPCTEAIGTAGIRRVFVGAIDPNPAHQGKGLRVLRSANIKVTAGMLAEEAERLNEVFNHWIVHGTPLVTVKAAMTLDGKIATAGGASKWITGEKARAFAMKLRAGADAILVGVNTVLADDPSLTVRRIQDPKAKEHPSARRRIILDSRARTPLHSRVVSDGFAACTTVVLTKAAPAKRVAALARRVQVWVAPKADGRIDLRWLLAELGRREVTSLLVEGGGEVNASFLLGRLAQRVAFFYAPKILGGRDARKAVGGRGVDRIKDALRLADVAWHRLGADLLLTARIK